MRPAGPETLTVTAERLVQQTAAVQYLIAPVAVSELSFLALIDAPRLQAAIQEAQRKIEDNEHAFQSQAAGELTQAKAELVKLAPRERATAVRAAKTMDLNVAGVDLIQSEEGPMVLEVNSSPGLEGVEERSGIDIADTIIEYIEDNAGTDR